MALHTDFWLAISAISPVVLLAHVLAAGRSARWTYDAMAFTNDRLAEYTRVARSVVADLAAAADLSEEVRRATIERAYTNVVAAKVSDDEVSAAWALRNKVLWLEVVGGVGAVAAGLGIAAPLDSLAKGRDAVPPTVVGLVLQASVLLLVVDIGVAVAVREAARRRGTTLEFGS